MTEATQGDTYHNTMRGERGYMSYEQYRRWCDSHETGYRRTGLIDKGLACEAYKDVRTVTVPVGAGEMAPAAVPIEYAAGYDEERCRRFCLDDDNKTPSEVMYWGMPCQELDSTQLSFVTKQLSEKFTGKVVYLYYDFDDAGRGTLANMHNLSTFLPVEHVSMTDQNDHEAVQCEPELQLYYTDIKNTTDVDLVSPVETYGYMASSNALESSNVHILGGSELSDELIEELWQLYCQRFKDLGRYHPVNMEDTKGGFIELLTDKSTTLSLSYGQDGLPVCFAYAVEDMSQMYWLNAVYLDALRIDNHRPVFIPGIVARQDGISGHSIPVLTNLLRAAANLGTDIRVLFENTETSEKYIPKIVDFCIKKSRAFSSQYPSKLDTHHYNLVKIDLTQVSQ